MERIGISSACFYPQTTEDSLLKICRGGVKTAELFFNSPSELKTEYIKEIIRIKNDYQLSIPSVHPFMSFAESFFLFSSYERRFNDILDLYKLFFEVMQKLDSEIFILHGAKIPGSVSDDVYFERFNKLIEIGKEYNVKVCQENVVHYRSESIEYIEKMKNAIGDDFGFVLDIKQARRTDIDPYDFIYKFGSSIRHIHISDYNSESTCIPPLEGNFDFSSFFSILQKINYCGTYIIELYDHSYKNESQVFNSYRKLNKLFIDYL